MEQSSIKSGPKFWTYLMNPLLTSFSQTGCSLTAYADDLSLIVRADTRKILIQRLEQALDQLLTWGKQNKISFNPAKTEAMYLKGGFQGPFAKYIRTKNFTVKIKEEIKYLGTVLDRKLTYLPHLRYITQKATSKFSVFRQICDQNWGLSKRHLKFIYKGVYESIVAYCSSLLFRVIHKQTVISKLRTAQRPALMLLTGAFSTTPNDLLPIIAGVLPLKYLIIERAVKYELSRNRCTMIGDVRFEPHQGHLVHAFIIEQIQQEWVSNRHKTMFMFMPEIANRYIYSLSIPRQIVQLITGHGNFPHYLHRFHPKLFPISNCHCGVPTNSSTHVLH
ncbi:MAG: hypothetical protein EOP45_16610, partial [Sphingobacteriaceae bacterium]